MSPIKSIDDTIFYLKSLFSKCKYTTGFHLSSINSMQMMLILRTIIQQINDFIDVPTIFLYLCPSNKEHYV